jgi:hypothetical protein
MILLDIHIWTWWINDTDHKAFTKYLFGFLHQLAGFFYLQKLAQSLVLGKVIAQICSDLTKS